MEQIKSIEAARARDQNMREGPQGGPPQGPPQNRFPPQYQVKFFTYRVLKKNAKKSEDFELIGL